MPNLVNGISRTRQKRDVNLLKMAEKMGTPKTLNKNKNKRFHLDQK